MTAEILNLTVRIVGLVLVMAGTLVAVGVAFVRLMDRHETRSRSRWSR